MRIGRQSVARTRCCRQRRLSLERRRQFWLMFMHLIARFLCKVDEYKFKKKLTEPINNISNSCCDAEFVLRNAGAISLSGMAFLRLFQGNRVNELLLRRLVCVSRARGWHVPTQMQFFL